MSIHNLIYDGKIAELTSYLKDNPDSANSVESGTGYTPLHVAVIKFEDAGLDKNVFSILLDHGAKIDVPNKIGLTPFQCACLLDYMFVMRCLADRGADINRPYTSGLTCLHAAIEDKNLAMTKHLLCLNANCQAICNNKTPLDIVVKKELPLIWANILIDNGAFLCCNFDKYEADADFLNILTENQIVIGAIKDGKSVNRSTPGFQKAITNVAELENAIKSGNVFNIEALLATANYLKKANPNNAAMIEILNELIPVLQNNNVKSVFSTSIDALIFRRQLEDKKNVLPPDVVEKVETRTQQLKLQVARRGPL